MKEKKVVRKEGSKDGRKKTKEKKELRFSSPRVSHQFTLK